MKNYNLGEVINFLVENNLWGKQCFNSKGIAGDPMEHMYNKDGVVIDMCWSYDYFEIFGLTDEDFKIIEDVHNNIGAQWFYRSELRDIKRDLNTLIYAIDKEINNPTLSLKGISYLLELIRDDRLYFAEEEIIRRITPYSSDNSLTKDELRMVVNKWCEKYDKEDEE